MMKLDTYTEPNDHIRKIFKDLGGDDFDRVRTYLFELNRSMQNQKAILRESHNEELRLFPNAKDLTNWVYDKDYKNYDTHFVGLLLNSALVLSFSLFESTFKKVCFFAAQKNGTFFTANSNTPGITGKCKTYIEENIGISLLEIEQYWNQLVLAQGLRNKIVHHSSTVPLGNEELREHVCTNAYIHVENTRDGKELQFYIKERLYIYEFLTISSSYLLWILIRLDHSKN